MIADELIYRIRTALGCQPTAEQQQAMAVLAAFLTAGDEAVMLLTGAAGTGKTSLAAAMVKAMAGLGQQLVLLAPTGRAAKVFSLYAGHPAYTIHRRIYRQKALDGDFSLNYNAARDTVFVVDEASMISQSEGSVAMGVATGLLDDLMHFVYNGRNCRLMLIGDRAQLPPVGEEASPALERSVLEGYGLQVYESTLCEVVRQQALSGILLNATRIRLAQTASGAMSLPKVCMAGQTDVTVVPGDELIEALATSYSQVGMDETLVVTRSNKRANIYNQGIRNQVLDREELLTTGDLLMVVKNNYYWKSEGATLSYIANGDRCVVRRVRNIHELYGFHFADVTLSFPDYDDYELTCNVVLDTLTAETPALTREQQERLFQSVMADYADIPLKSDRLKKLKEDRYYNALQVKFAYAATCHKAQGGQWEHVYLDQGYMTADMLSADYLHWLYTAFTRATRHLFLVNWPKAQTEGAEPET